MQDGKEESKKPTKEPVTESGSYYKQVADELMENEQDDLFGEGT